VIDAEQPKEIHVWVINQVAENPRWQTATILILKSYCNAAFTPGYMLPDTSCIHLYPLVAVNMFLVSATISLKIVASLSLVCCWIQVDLDINEQ